MRKWLLLPVSWLYGWVMNVRNILFDKGLFVSLMPDVPTICVGNLTVGGTGKTPAVEYLIKWYVRNEPGVPLETVTLSRGYGRRTKGFRITTESDTADTVGDEPLQLYRKFGHLVRVCVGERRADAIQFILRQFPETERILLDDAFQHRAVRSHLNVLLMDYNRPFYDDYPFPAGRLRESRHGASRANVIIVTKCPDNLNATERTAIEAHIRPYARPETPVFFAGLHYEQPVSFATHQSANGLTNVVLVSGLANADPLERYVSQVFKLVRHHRFADHYAYSRTNLNALLASLPTDAALLTTEKDWVKIDVLLTPNERATLPLYYLPVAMRFLEGEERFSALLTQDALKKS
ncbi:tetraacyldisaccharide 4'-kinase [Spirosoma montaniterrae]|uniref:tetraacyldisaccharide 4'-kinase n=1 Tax=Spirosoma montaniterrae TaxID=1178516 RepID=UPI0021506652|nr:tetraacyldisaccharide 4'-kinase [Spirosoma montaniterrae]